MADRADDTRRRDRQCPLSDRGDQNGHRRGNQASGDGPPGRVHDRHRWAQPRFHAAPGESRARGCLLGQRRVLLVQRADHLLGRFRVGPTRTATPSRGQPECRRHFPAPRARDRPTGRFRHSRGSAGDEWRQQPSLRTRFRRVGLTPGPGGRGADVCDRDRQRHVGRGDCRRTRRTGGQERQCGSPTGRRIGAEVRCRRRATGAGGSRERAH